MTVTFRINEFVAHTATGDTKYEFPADLTVLAGPIAVGKSTLFEAMKYALGCDALLSDVMRTSVASVSIDVSLGSERYLLRRDIAAADTSHVIVVDLHDKTRLRDHSTSAAEEPSLNSLLLTALGLPDDMLAASSSSSSTKKGNRISFADVLKYLYVPQAEINRVIANSEDSWYAPKRKAVFELLFDLTSPEILKTQSDIAVARGRVEEVEKPAATVHQFLSDSQTPSREHLEHRQEETTKAQDNAARRLDEIRLGLAPAIDGETQVLRELLLQAEQRHGEAAEQRSFIKQQLVDFEAETRAVRQDIERLARMQLAGARIAQIEFTTCPRCMQSVTQRHIPADHCPLCMQIDPVPHSSPDTIGAEAIQLKGQLQELIDQTMALRRELGAIDEAVEERAGLIGRLSDAITQRTTSRVTPQLQAYADAFSQVATAKVQLVEIDERLMLWDRADDLDARVGAEREALKGLEGHLVRLREDVAARKTEILGELNAEFTDTVLAVGVPGAVTAEIDPKSYLPLINGQQLSKLSPAGGLRTMTIVSYWVTLLTVALRRRDTLYPGFMLIDSPRTSLNDNDTLSEALYRRLVTMADAAEGRVQLIIGDNELPASYHRDYAQFDFTYDNPTIGSVPHPGIANVERLEG